MAIVGPDGRFLRVNPAFCHMLGYTREELQAKDFSAVTHPDDTDRSLEVAGEMIAGEIDKVDMVKRYVRKDGSFLWVSIHSSAVRDPSGEALYFVSQIRDITESITTRLTLEQRGAVLEAVAFAADRFLAGTDWEEEIHPVLAKMGGATGAERVTMWEDRREGSEVVTNLRFEWTTPEVGRIADSDRENVLHVPVLVGGRSWGHLGFHAREDRAWSPAVVDAIRVAAHLVGAAIARHDSMTTLRDFARGTVSAREEEGRRISRRIHDELGQSLTALKMDLSLQRRSADDAERTDRMMALVDDTIARLRDIAAELRPPVLDDLGLPGAIEWVADEFRKRTAIECELRVPEEIDIDAQRSIALYRILQEALANVVRHADATRVMVTLERAADDYVLEVRDNGRGMSEEILRGRPGLGIVGMRERAEPWGGDLVIESQGGRGTAVRARLPIQEPPTRPGAR